MLSLFMVLTQPQAIRTGHDRQRRLAVKMLADPASEASVFCEGPGWKNLIAGNSLCDRNVFSAQ